MNNPCVKCIGKEYCNDIDDYIKYQSCEDLRKIISNIRADAINSYVVNAITEFQKFELEHGYPTLGDISVILSDVAEQLKEQK